MNAEGQQRVEKLIAWVKHHRKELCGEDGEPSPRKMAFATQKKDSYWSDILRGTKPSFGSKAARQVETDLTIPHLLLDGGMADDSPGNAGIAHQAIERRPDYLPHRNKKDGDQIVIPEFQTGGSMGAGLVLRDQPGVIRGWSVNHEWLAKNLKHHTGADNLCIVTGFGDSMKGMYNSGDPLVCDTGVKTVEFDGVYFFRVGDEGFIKRLQRIPGEGIVAISENKAYRDWTIKPEMDFEVFGRILKAWKGEEF